MGRVGLEAQSYATSVDLIDKVHRLGEEVIRPAAADVDRDARFPSEALRALRKERLLAAYIPKKYGGLGCSVADLVAINDVLGRHCASTALIWAMHQIQVACIVHHGITSGFVKRYVHELADRQLLLASITSEAGVGGDLGRSITAVERDDNDECKLEKDATAVSYGDHAHGFLATARRTPDAASNDQVLVLLRRSETQIDKTSDWDTLGMRGTCSSAFRITAAFGQEQILPAPFSDIALQTMVPISHILWSACWLGIATDAVARAGSLVRSKARKQPADSSSGDVRLVEAVNLLQLMRANLNDSVQEYEQVIKGDEPDETSFSMGLAIKTNNLKIASSELVVKIVGQTLAILGMAGYTSNSPYSVSRHLRDAYSAGTMVGNGRIYATNASLLLMHKGL